MVVYAALAATALALAAATMRFPPELRACVSASSAIGIGVSGERGSAPATPMLHVIFTGTLPRASDRFSTVLRKRSASVGQWLLPRLASALTADEGDSRIFRTMKP